MMQEFLTPKLSDGGEKGKNQRRTLPRRSLERLVRRVTSESGEREDASHRRGNEGRCRRERPTEANDDPGTQPATTKRTRTDVPRKRTGTDMPPEDRAERKSA